MSSKSISFYVSLLVMILKALEELLDCDDDTVTTTEKGIDAQKKSP